MASSVSVRPQLESPTPPQHQVHTEWITSYLVCEDCGRDYAQARDECPDCGCLEAQLVDTGSAGRFWGYRGLRAVLAARRITPEVGIAAGRVLRRWYHSKGLTKEVTVVRVDQGAGRVYYRRSHKRKRLFSHTRGFVTVNDGPACAAPRSHPALAPVLRLRPGTWCPRGDGG